MDYSFVMKRDLGLESPLALHVLSPSWTWYRVDDPHPANLIDVICKVGKRQKLENYTPEALVDSWLKILVDSLKSPGLCWGDDGVAAVDLESQTESFKLSRLKNAQRKTSSVAFLYRKPGDRLTIERGTPRRVDAENDLMTLETEGLTHSRNFLISEIVGLYEFSENIYIWRFSFEPMLKGRTKVSIDFDDDFRRTSKRRKPRANPLPKVSPLDSQPKSLVNLLTPTGDPSKLLGELFELITPSGERLGLRVEYMKTPEDS